MNKLFCFYFVTIFYIFSIPVNTQGIKCDICDLAVTAVENYLESNKTESQLQLMLDNVCTKTPFSSDCQGLINQYLPKIIDLLEKQESPQVICEQLHFCSSNIEYKSYFCELISELRTFISSKYSHNNNVYKFILSSCDNKKLINKERILCHNSMNEFAKIIFDGINNFQINHHTCDQNTTLL